MTTFPQLKYLADCEPGELVRLQVGNEARWAIRCARTGQIEPVLILGSTEIKTVNIREGGRITGDFDTIPVLAYGTDYTIEPDHSGPITILVRDAKQIPGRIVQAESGLYLVAVAEGYRNMDYVPSWGMPKRSRSLVARERSIAAGGSCTTASCETACL
jgi:hypothetical protein